MPGLRTAGRHAGNTSTADGAADWRASAACAGVDPETFFPVGRQGRRRLAGDGVDLNEPAKQVCRACPAVRDCLRYALGNDVQGVWGGTTYEEREQLREQHGITAVPIHISVQGDNRLADVARLSGGGYSAPEICAELRIPLNQIHQYLTRARRGGLIEKDLPHDRTA